MKIEFQDNKMIVTHSTGHVDIYDKKHLEQERDHIQDTASELRLHIEQLNDWLSQITAPEKVSVVKRIVNWFRK